MNNSSRTEDNLRTVADSSAPVMIFDLETGGHHPMYLRYLVKYWLKNQVAGYLFVVVSSRFFTKHKDVIELIQKTTLGNIEVVSVGEDEYSERLKAKSLTLNALKTWSIMRKYAARLKVTHCFIDGIDHVLQVPMALGLRAPCPISGIYFRVAVQQYGAETLKESLRRKRQQALLELALRNPSLRNLYCIDPYAPEYIHSNFRLGKKAVFLPDPVECTSVDEETRAKLVERLKIKSDNKVLLFFGHIAERKGIYQLLDSLMMLSREIAQQLTLLLVGEIAEADAVQVNYKTDKLIETQGMQLIRVNEYVADEDVPAYFAVSDLILAPYQRHVGSSGILLLAAATQKPVLSSDYGVMGRLVKEYKLGMALDTTKAGTIALFLHRFIREGYIGEFNVEKAVQYAELNSAEQFSKIIINGLFER